MATRTFSLRRMPIGVEVIGLAPGSESDSDVQSALREAWFEHGLLLFRNIDNEQHLALSRCFGELEMHPIPEMRAEEDPYFMELGGAKPAPAYVYDGTDIRVNRIAWHRDSA